VLAAAGTGGRVDVCGEADAPKADGGKAQCIHTPGVLRLQHARKFTVALSTSLAIWSCLWRCTASNEGIGRVMPAADLVLGSGLGECGSLCGSCSGGKFE
jgi:hypothetical protein